MSKGSGGGNAYKLLPSGLGLFAIFVIICYYMFFGLVKRNQNALPSVILQAELIQVHNVIEEGGDLRIIYETNLNIYNGLVRKLWKFDHQMGNIDFRQINRLFRLILLRAIMIKEWPMYCVGFWLAFHLIGMIKRHKREVESIAKNSNELNIGYGLANAIPFVGMIYTIAPFRASIWNVHVLMGLTIILLLISRILVTQNKNVKGFGG